MIPYARQSIAESDISAVVEVLRSDWLTQGPTNSLFEKAILERCGAQYAVAVNSATSALHIACLTLGLKAGDYLWTSCNTFVASANCALYCGAKVDFVDIDPKTYNLCPIALEEKLIKAKKENKLPKIVIPVHFAGQPCDMHAIRQLADTYGFYIVEDASHAIGATYKKTQMGSCYYSDMTIFSFHPVKLLTTGEGGMIVTNRVDWHEKLVLLRSHGITRHVDRMDQKSEGDWYYQQIALGYNYRMTDIQAALGLSQLQQLDSFLEKRRILANRYFDRLKNLPVILPYQHADGASAWHLYVILVDDQHDIFHRLHQSGVKVNVHYIPVHLHPFYKKLGFKAGDFPEAEKYYNHTISLPMYYQLNESEQDHIIQLLHELI